MLLTDIELYLMISSLWSLSLPPAPLLFFFNHSLFSSYSASNWYKSKLWFVASINFNNHLNHHQTTQQPSQKAFSTNHSFVRKFSATIINEQHAVAGHREPKKKKKKKETCGTWGGIRILSSPKPLSSLNQKNMHVGV